MKCTPLKNPWAAQLKERIIEGKNKESSCHRASRNVFSLIKKISIHLPKWYRLVVTAFISLHPKVSKPKFHPLQHLSSSPPQAGTYFPILWSVFLCCCRLQTDTFASMMISKVVVPVTLILVTSLHTFALPAVPDYSEPGSSRQVGSFPPRIILRLRWRTTINNVSEQHSVPMGILGIDHMRGTWGINVRIRTDVV